MTFKAKHSVLILLGVLFVLPFLLMLWMSFAGSWRFPQLFPAALSIRNWLKVFTGQEALGSSFLLSLLISVSVAAFSTMGGFITSKFIAFHRWRQQLLLISYFPFVLSPVIYAACIQFYFVWLGISGSIFGVMAGQLIIVYPFAVILFSGYWGDRLRSLENLVTTLGGNTLQTYLKVLIPLSKGILLVCFFQTFLISWFEYGLTSVLGVGKIQTLTVKVYQYIQEANIYFAALASCLLILPPAVLLWINKRFVFRQVV